MLRNDERPRRLFDLQVFQGYVMNASPGNVSLEFPSDSGKTIDRSHASEILLLRPDWCHEWNSV